jgi:hypothetical protein
MNDQASDSYSRLKYRLGVLLLGSLAALLAFFVLSRPQDEEPPWQVSTYATQFPEKSEYLKTVKEPIKMLFGGVFGYHGDYYVEFSDATGKLFGVWKYNSFDENLGLTFVNNQTHDKFVVPYGAAEEKEFLGMLERWASSEPEAKFFIRTKREARNTGDKSYLRSLTSQEWQARGVALYLLNSLRIRNGESIVF